jgi:hypothetical protein
MILKFVLAFLVYLFFFYFTIKLLDAWKMKRLRKKFPEGTETKVKAVAKIEDIPTNNQNKEKIISELLNVQ